MVTFIFAIAAIQATFAVPDCNAHSNRSLWIENAWVEETPAVMIYPPNPVPAFKLEGKLEGKAGHWCYLGFRV